MRFLLKRAGRYYFNKRVPKIYKDIDPRVYVRFALKTDSATKAMKDAAYHNEAIEEYWSKRKRAGSSHPHDQYLATVERADSLGLRYLQSEDVAKLSLVQLIERLYLAQQNPNQPNHVQPILGGVKTPSIRISDCPARYWDYSKHKTLNKSPDQLRKWKNPRIKAFNNLIRCIGNKPIQEITREDTLKFQDWWIQRIDKENLVSGSANKDIIYIKTMMESVSENLKLGLDINHLFRKLILTKDDSIRRMPFETDYIRSTLLNPNNLSGLEQQARCVLMAIAETGAGISEQVGLLPEDIFLNAEIPHIAIVPRNKRALKTKYRRRTIPLVGYALEAFKECPDGFTKYRDSADSLSSILSHYLRNNELMPTPQHTVYSLRHSFQDRLLAVNAPDRVQADLMGHKFHRPAYGDGASLKHKLEWLERIKLMIFDQV